MADRPLYVLPFRVLVLAVVAVFVVGALGGGVSAWLVTRAALRGLPTGTRVVERVEQVPGDEQTLFVRVAEKSHGGVVGIYDRRGGYLQAGLALTADGVVVTPASAVLSSSPQVRLPDGTFVGGALLRTYPEKGLLLLRVSGSFPAPRFAARADLLPGTTGVLLRRSPDTPSYDVQPVTVSSLALPSASEHRARPGVDLWGRLAPVVPQAFHGSPLVGSDGRILGIVSGDQLPPSLIPAADVDLLLQDTLRTPQGETVSVLAGLRGRWIGGSEAARRSLPTPVGFLVEGVPSASPAAAAGLHAQDIIVGVDGKRFPGAGSLWGLFLEGARNGKPVTLTVQRGDEEVNMRFTPALQ